MIFPLWPQILSTITFIPLFGPITKLPLSFVTFRVSRFPVSHLTHETVKLGLQNTLNMSKTTRVYFGVLHVAPVQSAEPSQSTADDQPATEGSSGDRAITIPGSPELGPTGGAEPDGTGRSESNEGDPAPRALQVILPSYRRKEKPSK